MAVELPALGPLLAVRGVRMASGGANIKHGNRDDVSVLGFGGLTTMAGVFTQSHFAAAPVKLARARLQAGRPLAWLINSGNANAATGPEGLADAESLCAEVAAGLDIASECVLPFSTGVIGERLPVDRIRTTVRDLVGRLEDDAWLRAARSIMTTDTVPKVLSAQLPVAGRTVTLTGMAKGSGMIRPDMATLLGFVCCDARVSARCLQRLTARVAELSFNRVTVDGDTSTNDALVVAATGEADHSLIDDPDSPEGRALLEGLASVAVPLAQWIARDAEGSTRFVTVRVRGGRNEADCRAVAYTIAESPLVKTAMFAGDPNWGRFCMAIGRAPVADLDPSRVSVDIDGVPIARDGMSAPGYDESAAARVMAQPEYEVTVDLGMGHAEALVWTSDLSYEYVRINAEYRT